MCVLFTVVYNFTYMYTRLNDKYKHCTYYVCKSSGKFIIILTFSLDEVMSGAQEAKVEFDSTEVQPILLQEDPI